MATAKREIPRAPEAEDAVLGAMLLNRGSCQAAVGLLVPGHFHAPARAAVFAACEALFVEGQPVSPLTAADELTRTGNLELAGGLRELIALQAASPPTSQVAALCGIVAEKAAQRALIVLTTDGTAKAYDGAVSARELTADLLSALLTMQQDTFRGNLQTVGDLAGLVYDQVSALHDGTAPRAITTGFYDLDRIVGGMIPGQLWIPAAITSAGKTALMLTIALHVALTQGLPVLMHSLEMTGLEVAKRLMAAEAKVPAERLRDGTVEPHDWPELSRALTTFSEAPMWIDDNPAAGVGDIRANILDITVQVGAPPALVIVDYAQIMETGRAENRQQQVAEIARSLKALARRPMPNDDRAVVVMAASQLRRGVEERKDKRPILSDLRESGSLGQDADVVLGLFRDEVHNPNTTEPGHAELAVLKSRTSATGRLMLTYDGRHTQFLNAPRIPVPEPDEMAAE